MISRKNKLIKFDTFLMFLFSLLFSQQAECFDANAVKISDYEIIYPSHEDDFVYVKSLNTNLNKITQSLKVCRNSDGSIQDFTFRRDTEGRLSLIACGVHIGGGVNVTNSSICQFEAEDTAIDGNVEIIDSFIQGGTIDSLPSKDHEKKKTDGPVRIERSKLIGAYSINGKVRILDSEIAGDSTINGSDASIGIWIINESKIAGNQLISGSLNIDNVEMEDESTITANPVSGYSIIQGWPTRIVLSGTNNISGYFYIQKSVKNITVTASTSPYTYGTSHGVRINSNVTSIGENVVITGFVSIWEGIIGDGVTLNGSSSISSSCTDCEGVTIVGSSEVHGTSTVLSGYLYLGSTKIYDSQIYISGPSFDDRWSRLHYSRVENSNISGSIYAEYRSFINKNLSGTLDCRPVGSCI